MLGKDDKVWFWLIALGLVTTGLGLLLGGLVKAQAGFLPQARVQVESLTVTNDSQPPSATQSALPVLRSLTKKWWQLDFEETLPGQVVADDPNLACHWEADLDQQFDEVHNLQSCQVSCQSGQLFVQSATPPSWLAADATDLELLPIVNQASATQAGEILITEVMWAGSYQGSHSVASDEWIEFYNPTDRYWQLSDLQLFNAAYGDLPLDFPDQSFLPPYSYTVLGGESAARSQLKIPSDFYVPGLLLSNSQAGLQLRTKQGTVIDGLPAGQWQAGQNDAGLQQRASAQKIRPDLPTNQWTSWQTCQLRNVPPASESAFWKDVARANNCGTPGSPSIY